MTKLFIFALFLSSMGFCFAEDGNLLEIQLLINNGLHKNYESIKEKSLSLTLNEKMFLFNSYEKNSGIPLVLNMATGLGIGSYIQGDAVGGTIQLSGAVLGTVLLYSAFAVPGPYSEAVLTTAMTSYLLSWLYGCVSPFVFKYAYNKKLKNALQFDNVSYSITPSFDEGGGGRVSAILSFKL